MKLALLVLFATSLAAAQDVLRQLDFSRLSAKADDTVEVNLDGTLLALAARFMGDSGDEAKAKQILNDIKGIYVRTLKFAKEGEYSIADIEPIRKQVTGAGWSSIVDIRTKRTGGDNTGVYIKSDGKQIQGLVVLAAEPRELTVVNIMGNIDPERLRDLGGKFGIPKIDLEKKPLAPKKKDD